jgi:hypothetical protein
MILWLHRVSVKINDHKDIVVAMPFGASYTASHDYYYC